jgi:hypothetical protein
MGCVPPTASDGLAQSDPWSRHGARSAMLRLMITRLTIVMCLLVLGLSLGACTKCGWIWDEGPRSCHSDPPR